MKTSLCRLLFVVVAALPAWGADPLTTAFQQGLLEEELNRDLTNAIVAYERVVQGLDEQRPLAATALFRLGECYRKLGQTNDAVAVYQRILRDFTEEATLAKLSRENLAALGFGPPAPAQTNLTTAAASPARSDAADEADRLAAQLAGIERLKDDPEKQGQAVLAFFPDEGLNRMLWHLDILKQQAAFAHTNQTAGKFDFRFPIDSGGGGGGRVLVELVPGTPSPRLEEYLATQLNLIARRAEHILKGQQARLFVLQSGAQVATPATAAPAPATLSPAELASIQEEIKLVEQEQLSVQKRFETGRASQADLRKVQRELLQLQRRLPENASKERQVALLGQEQQLLQENLQEIQKQIQVGAAAHDDEIPVRREILALQRELAAARRAPVVAASPAGGGPTPATNEEADEIKRIQAIIRDSPDLVNAHNATGDGGTPLHAAAEKGYLAVTEYLLENRADVNARDNKWGYTPLHIAAQNGHKKLCEILLAAGANVNAPDYLRYTPLHRAASKGYLSVAETLLAKGAQVNTAAGPDDSSGKRNSPLEFAALAGFPAMMELLLAHGADLEYRDKDGSTPLIRVVSTYPARESCVKVLLDKGANVNAVDVHGQNALAYAVRDAKMTLVTLLLDHHAEIDARVSAKWFEPYRPGVPGGWRESLQDREWTAIFVSVGFGDVETTRLLLDRGADINAKAASGLTPVHWAVLQNKLDTLKLLLERKAEVNVRDSGGNTPLHYAVDHGAADMVEALLAAGADPNAPGWTNGETQPWWPLFKAEVLNDPVGNRIAEALLKHGADVNAKTTNGWTALHRAVQYNVSELTELLVANKAEVNAHGSQPKDEPKLGVRKAEVAASVAPSGGSARGLPTVRPGLRPPTMPPPMQTVGSAFTPGATPSITANQDVTPLHIAIANRNLNLAKFLLDHGADVNARDADGRTPLHFAVNRRDLDLIRLLLDAKADPDAKDAAGETPVAMAGKPYAGFQGISISQRGVFTPGQPKDIIALLRERGAKEPPEPKPAKSIFETDPEKAKAGGKVSIFGAVRGNGLQGNWFMLPAGTPTSLSQTLLVVGFADNALMSAVKLTRVNPDTKQPETKTVSLLGLKRGEPVEEILLQDGDRVDVPKQTQ